MGLCVNSDENEQGLYFIIREESVVFHDPDDSEEIFPDGYVEIGREHLQKIVALCSDEKWKKKIFDDRN